MIQFINFYYRPELLQSTLKLFDENMEITMSIDWDEIIQSYDNCHWENAVFKNNTIYTMEYFNQIAQKYGWTKICLYNTGYLLYEGENQGEIIIIPKKSSLAIIALIIIIVFGMILSFILIAFCKYKKDNYINDSELELNDHNE